MDIHSVQKALADSGRLRVIWLLMELDELCLCEITEVLGFAAPTVSRHMSILNQAGLVNSRKEGRWVYYSLESLEKPLIEYLRWSRVGFETDIAKDKEKISGCEVGK